MKKQVAALLCCTLLFALCVPVLADDGGGHWWNAFPWFGDVGNWIKYLFVPEDNYFHERLYYLNEMLNAKFAGIGQLYQVLDQFFRVFSSPPTAGITFKIPSNFLFQGYHGITFDVFTSAKQYISFFRTVLTAGCVLLTVIVCYHKLRTFFTEEE